MRGWPEYYVGKASGRRFFHCPHRGVLGRTSNVQRKIPVVFAKTGMVRSGICKWHPLTKCGLRRWWIQLDTLATVAKQLAQRHFVCIDGFLPEVGWFAQSGFGIEIASLRRWPDVCAPKLLHLKTEVT